ncbi:hypothetical protein MBLNU459_g2348t1 [Dothideomycetes sp. NU459]
MSFSFNFSGEDIDESIDQDVIGDAAVASVDAGANVLEPPAAAAAAVEVIQHDLQEMLATLPDRICYASTTIESPTGKILHLPRRELFDVRVQLMSEDESSNDETLTDISTSDIRTNVYEGGFKTWECSVDLASLLLDRGPRKDIDDLHRCDQIIELGAGTALPTLTLFQHALFHRIPLSFILADFNASVLRLVTLPNLLLTWARFSPAAAASTHAIPDGPGSGDLDVTPALLAAFTADLAAAGVALNLVSGPWSPALAALLPPAAPDLGALVLAAETIYSPASTRAFVDLLVLLLARVRMAKAVVAAKRIYFGVGGSVDLMKEMCAEKGAVAYEVENAGVAGMDAGVGRALVEVQMY